MSHLEHAAVNEKASDEQARSAAAHGSREPVDFGIAHPTAGLRAALSLVPGVVVVGVLASIGFFTIAPLAGWDVAVLTYLAWVWFPLWHADPDRTEALSVREDPSGAVTDLVVLAASVVSLVGVGDVIMLGAHKGDPVGPGLAIALAVSSVVASWALVHTVFTLRYARLYYLGPDGGICFNQDTPPRYTDFAYVAFTIGMTFQVSDTDLRNSTIRATALRHSMLSYLFGAIIVAVTINLVAGLAK